MKSVNPIKVKSLSKEVEEVKVKVENGHTSQIVVKGQNAKNVYEVNGVDVGDKLAHKMGEKRVAMYVKPQVDNVRTIQKGSVSHTDPEKFLYVNENVSITASFTAIHPVENMLDMSAKRKCEFSSNNAKKLKAVEVELCELLEEVRVDEPKKCCLYAECETCMVESLCNMVSNCIIDARRKCVPSMISNRSKIGRKSGFFSYPPVKSDVSGPKPSPNEPVELPVDVPLKLSRSTAKCDQEIGSKGNRISRQKMPVSDSCSTKNVETNSVLEPISATNIKNAYSLLLAPQKQGIEKSKISTKIRLDVLETSLIRPKNLAERLLQANV